MNQETAFLIIGSGVAGGLIARELLKKGLGPVTMLEAGPTVKMRDRRSWLDYVMSGRLPYDHLGDRADDYETRGIQPWRLEGGRLLARGGSTLHWGGWCPRMKPEDFSLASRRGSGGLDWPWSYEEMEPYYLRAEHALGVAGNSKAQDPPRKGNYLFEAPPYTQTDGVVIRAMDKLGISYEHMPIARNGRPINGHPACMTTGTCYYCPIGGRFTGDQPLERLMEQKHFVFKEQAPVTRLLMDSRKRVIGAMFRDGKTGVEQSITAEKVIVCAGSLETPKLLLASANQWWPRGIGNDTDQVGRHLVANPYFYARGVSKDNPEKLQEEVHFPTLSSRFWDGPEHQREGKFIMNRGESPDAAVGRLMGEGKTPKQIREDLEGKQVIELQGALQTFSHAANRVSPAGGLTRFGLPRTQIESPVEAVSKQRIAAVGERLKSILETMGYQLLPGDVGLGVYPQRGDHAMCTCRISSSPKDGVVDSNLQVHGVDNLYIASNAVFPSGAAANPTLTLVAMLMRFTDQLTGI